MPQAQQQLPPQPVAQVSPNPPQAEAVPTPPPAIHWTGAEIEVNPASTAP